MTNVDTRCQGPDPIWICGLTSVGNLHFEDKIVIRSSYLYNRISYTGEMASCCWIRVQGIMRCRMDPVCLCILHCHIERIKTIFDSGTQRMFLFIYLVFFLSACDFCWTDSLQLDDNQVNIRSYSGGLSSDPELALGRVTTLTADCQLIFIGIWRLTSVTNVISAMLW